MKNKKLIGLLIVLAFITVLVVLNSTLFTLQSISVNWLTTKCELETLKDYTMVDSIEKGESIFLVKKDKIVENLEKKYSYLRVVSIETKFPNKIVILHRLLLLVFLILKLLISSFFYLQF